MFELKAAIVSALPLWVVRRRRCVPEGTLNA